MIDEHSRQRPPVGKATTAVVAALSVVAAALMIYPPVRDARAEIVSHGPTLAVGLASKLGNDMVIPAFGYRVQLGAGDLLAGWAEKIGTELSFPIEAHFGVVTGDESAVEFQIVPMLRLEPRSLQDGAVIPFLEGGIGLMYTGLDNLRIGSNILFSDNVGVGASFPFFPATPSPWTRWSLGYRYRHASHAGLWADANSGLDTHFIVLTLE